MQSSHGLDRLRTDFDDDRLVAQAGLLLPATLAAHLGLRELVDEHLDLGSAPGRAHAGDTLIDEFDGHVGRYRLGRRLDLNRFRYRANFEREVQSQYLGRSDPLVWNHRLPETGLGDRDVVGSGLYALKHIKARSV